MIVWHDFEFIEWGQSIDPISVGMVKEDGSTYYAEFAEAKLLRAGDWVKANVLPRLTGEKTPRALIASQIQAFVGPDPEFWGYYADYDHVVLCQLYGSMTTLPKGWPMFTLDIKQWCVMLGNPRLPEKNAAEHNALADAKWNRKAHRFLEQYQRDLLTKRTLEEQQRKDRR